MAVPASRPWRAEPDKRSNGESLVVVASNGIILATTPMPLHPMDWPNARLMAAAPDLLEALKNLLARIPEALEFDCVEQIWLHTKDKEVAAALAAIAMAEGEASYG